jgi:hypothetical protein
VADAVSAGGAGREVLAPAAIGRGAAVAVALCLPLALVSQAVADGEGGDGLAVLLFVAVLLGLAGGGFVAGQRARAAPFTNGGLAAVAAYVAIQGTALVVRGVVGDGDGDGPSIPSMVFTGLLAYGCGLAGGAVASRRRRGGTQ